MLPNTIRLYSESSEEGVSTCNPHRTWKYCLQADVVPLFKKLDCTSKLASEVRMVFSKRRLNQADIIAVNGESNTVMKVFSKGIVLKKRLGEDIIISIPWHNQSAIFMSESPQSSIWLKLGNFCQNENIQHATIIYLYASIILRKISDLNYLLLNEVTMLKGIEYLTMFLGDEGGRGTSMYWLHEPQDKEWFLRFPILTDRISLRFALLHAFIRNLRKYLLPLRSDSKRLKSCDLEIDLYWSKKGRLVLKVPYQLSLDLRNQRKCHIYSV